MAFDSTVMAAVVSELRGAILHGRISRIHQPEPDTLVLLIYAGGRNHRLLLSANPKAARLHLTGLEKRNPPSPPTFCMLLRKYVDGGRILAVDQVGRERIARIRIGVTDELGNPAEFVLVTEVMGKHSNVILLNPAGRIVDAARRVTEEVNRHREVLPGLPYVAPPPTGKQDPDAVTASLFADASGEEAAWKAVLDRVDGLGPLLAREAVALAGAAPDATLGEVTIERLVAAIQALGRPTAFTPTLYFTPEGRLRDFHVLPLTAWAGRSEPLSAVSQMLDAFFGRRDDEERFSSLRGSLAKLVRDEVARVQRKMGFQRQSLETAENAEAFRVKGELITANLWRVARGDQQLDAENYYDGTTVTIDLDSALTPAENAQAYYRRYQKARSGLANIREQLARGAEELAYLEQVEASLMAASSLPDLEEIRRELQQEGYLGERSRAKGATPRTDKPAPPLSLRSSDGLEIWIGRNNRQNDYLTLRLAAPTDYWLHTKEIAGSHVILRVPPGATVPDRALHEAALLAAYHSRARDSANVPVDYALRKHVRKPSGARPGMVIYDHQRTLFVTPDPSLHPILQQVIEGGPQA